MKRTTVDRNNFDCIDTLVRPEGEYDLWEDNMLGDTAPCVVTLNVEIVGETYDTLQCYVNDYV